MCRGGNTGRICLFPTEEGGGEGDGGLDFIVVSLCNVNEPLIVWARNFARDGEKLVLVCSFCFLGNLNFKLKIRISGLGDLRSKRNLRTFSPESACPNVSCYCVDEKSWIEKN